MDYIERIKKIKSEKKITNDKLAELSGIPLGTLSKIMAGISDSPKLSSIVAIADVLGCSLDYIVNGTPENDNNYTLTDEEIEFIEVYRGLDSHSKDVVRTVASKEAERAYVKAEASDTEKKSSVKRAKILATPSTAGLGKRTVLLYDLSVSAGTGVYLDDAQASEISILDNEKTRMADFALRINGNSMEPRYHDGDIVLVEDTDSVEVGELGIFVLDGNGYFKQFGGDRLISLNEDYGDILLRGYSEIVCCGRVVGRLKKKI
ncbi:MAG: helix-turn-helix domain-containing protein [Clostridia bacterium]|nr:helix-turn-helix domain-containing protein [Clostridia bacterium]